MFCPSKVHLFFFFFFVCFFPYSEKNSCMKLFFSPFSIFFHSFSFLFSSSSSSSSSSTPVSSFSSFYETTSSSAQPQNDVSIFFSSYFPFSALSTEQLREKKLNNHTNFTYKQAKKRTIFNYSTFYTNS